MIYALIRVRLRLPTVIDSMKLMEPSRGVGVAVNMPPALQLARMLMVPMVVMVMYMVHLPVVSIDRHPVVMHRLMVAVVAVCTRMHPAISLGPRISLM